LILSLSDIFFHFFRENVLGYLPKLKFLDATPVTNEEREVAIVKYKNV
jgi:hypothetical protein